MALSNIPAFDGNQTAVSEIRIRIGIDDAGIVLSLRCTINPLSDP